MKNTISIRFFKQFLLFASGASGYYLIEVLFRGYSHYSMALCGGICLCLIYFVFERFPTCPLIMKCLLGSLIITSAEFITGCIVNLAFHLDVWDYSEMPLNLLGQICLPFSVIWFLFCFPIAFLCFVFREKVFTCPVFRG